MQSENYIEWQKTFAVHIVNVNLPGTAIRIHVQV